MHELRLLALSTPEADVGPPGLEVHEVRATRNLKVAPDSRGPNLQVVALCVRKAHIARAKQYHAIVETESLKDGFGIDGQRLQFIEAVLRFGQLDEFHLVELV